MRLPYAEFAKPGVRLVRETVTAVPPAPSEAALLLHDFLSERGVRGECEISLVMPFGTPVPPSPDSSEALLAAFGGRGIEFVGGSPVASLDAARSVAVLEDGSELPCDPFLGVPKHRAPEVVLASGMADGGYIKVDPRTLETRFPRIYTIGDVATLSVPKAGVFSEGQSRVVAPRSSHDCREARSHARTTGGARRVLRGVRFGARPSRRRRLRIGPEADRHAAGAVV